MVLGCIEAGQILGLNATDFRDPHLFPSDVAAFLAEHGIYNTAQPQYPGERSECSERENTARQIGKLAENASNALKNTPDFEEALATGQLAHMIGNTVLRSVTAMHLDDIHVADPEHNESGEAVGGVATIGSTTFVVRTVDDLNRLGLLFQAWARASQSSRNPYRLTVDMDNWADHYMLTVSHLNEYSVRMLEKAHTGIQAREDKELTGTLLPQEKVPASRWYGENYTFAPVVDMRMRAVQQHYIELGRNTTATYREGVRHSDFGDELEHRPEPLGDSPSAVWEVLRKGMTTVIRPMRGSSAFNQDQHPKASERLDIEKGVRIKRETGLFGHPGRPGARALKSAEKVKEAYKNFIAKSQDELVKSAFEFTGVLVGIGYSTVAEIGLWFVPGAAKGIWHYWSNTRAWHRQQKEYAESVRQFQQFQFRRPVQTLANDPEARR